MRYSFLKHVALVICLFGSGIIYPQKIVTTKGEERVRVEQNQTKKEARKIAREFAIINAIENAFGTYLEGTGDITIQDGRDYFTYIGSIKVKGDWIETLDEKYTEDFQKIETKDGVEVINWIICEVKGKAREATPKAMIKYEVLNGPNIGNRTDEFISGEQLFLFFQSPVDGYLSVFIEDNDAVFRCFPYKSMTGSELSAGRVEADKEYLLFSKEPEHNTFQVTVDEPELFTSKAFEFNNIYLIFSENAYLKPILEAEKKNSEYKEGYTIPKSLSKKDFQRWLSENRAKNQGFLDIREQIKIVSNR